MSPPRKLFGAIYVSYGIFREAIWRTMGVPRESPLIVAMFSLGMLGTALARLAAPAVKWLKPRPPTVPGALTAVALPIAFVERTTGVSAGDVPIVGVALASAMALPALRVLAGVARALPAALGAVARFLVRNADAGVERAAG